MVLLETRQNPSTPGTGCLASSFNFSPSWIRFLCAILFKCGAILSSCDSAPSGDRPEKHCCSMVSRNVFVFNFREPVVMMDSFCRKFTD